jgi:imidazole glycerol-phosphate synthase subunit HisH
VGIFIGKKVVKVHLIDCGLGNIRSVHNAFRKIGCDVGICHSVEQLDGARYIVLPGVGAFGEGIAKLRAKGFDAAIISAVHSGTKLLGICLGMQFLFEKSYEFGEHQGLGLIPGEIREMKVAAGLKIPHIGWNDTQFVKSDSVLQQLPNPCCYYYVNSFSCICADAEDVLATYEYGGTFVAVARKGNVLGVQFHPEKSHHGGLKLLENFVGTK